MPRRHFGLLIWQSALLLLGLPSLLDGQSFTVSPRGNDRNAGTHDRPFRTLQRARDAVREFRRVHPHYQGDVVVTLRGGRYALSRPLVLHPGDGGRDDSPTIFRAHRGESPVVSGGIELREWEERRTSAGEILWVTRLPETLLESIPAVRQMWVRGQQRLVARHPNRGYLRVASVPDVTPSTAWNDGQNSFAWQQGDLPPVPTGSAGSTAAAEAVVMTLWTESHLTLTSIDHDSLLLRTKERTIYRLGTGDQYYLLNYAGGFDLPGEFLVDAAAREILYRPKAGERLSDFRPVLPVLPQLLVIDGDARGGRFIDHLRFEGITFAHTNWSFLDQPAKGGAALRQAGFGQAAVGLPAAVEARGMRYGSFFRCTVRDGGTYGIALGGGCSDNTIDQCVFSRLGGGGVMIGSTAVPATDGEAASRNCVANSEIGEVGLLYHSAVGIWIGQSSGNRIFHNHIHDLFYSGISIGWTWGYGPAACGGNLVEWNHVHHIGKPSGEAEPILADLGGIYTLGPQPGTEVRRNFFHDIHARNYGGWGIYYDEGSTGILSEENIVARTSHEGFHQHYGKQNVFRNNILAFGGGYQIRRDHEEPHTSFAFERNIVIWDSGPFYTREDPGWSMIFGRNVYWRRDGKDVMSDSLSFREWKSSARDTGSLFADPRFRDPAADDFRLAKESPALALGFRPFSIARAIDRKPFPAESLQHRARNPERRLLYNNDGSNIIMMADTLTPARAYTRIDPLAGSGVTTFLHNVNPGQNLGYPSRAGEMYTWLHPPADSGQGWNLLGTRMSHNLARLVAEGIDPVGMVLDRARFRGFESFVTFRMNELHDVDRPESPLLSRFWKDHPEYRVGGYEGWGKEALNYGIPQVREYIYRIIAEVVARYPVEGLELDFMRFPYYFPFDRDSMPSHAVTMNRFVERIRRLTDSTGRARSRPILLAARVPTTLQGCAHVGLDPAFWARKKLIDFLVISPFLSTETDVPVGEFKRVCGNIPVYPTLEFTIGSRQMTREEKRAAAALLYAAGGDGLYLFNYFVAWDAGFEADMEVLADLADPGRLSGKEKLYTIAAPRYPVPGVSLPGQVPLALREGEAGSVTIPTAESMVPKRVLLRLECDEDLRPGDLTVRFNGTRLPDGIVPAEAQIFPQQVWPSAPVQAKTLEFAVHPGTFRKVNDIAIVARKRVTLRWVYLALLHRD